VASGDFVFESCAFTCAERDTSENEQTDAAERLKGRIACNQSESLRRY
jgi:hypothetical protein